MVGLLGLDKLLLNQLVTKEVLRGLWAGTLMIILLLSMIR